ncbi:hypothetical protein ACFZCG_20930 [Streptomyces tanashiensis]|uniref:hypothetical protein n=1 Tax=Streptomyces tanashiensis TaxID=67367 RepID=UPI0036EED184
MSRRRLPELAHGSFRTQDVRRPVEPLYDRVRVDECSFRRLADGERTPPVFFVRPPGSSDGTGVVVACTPEDCRRWVRAAIEYVTTLNEAGAELSAAHRRAASVPWWRPVAARRAFGDWEATLRRHGELTREAAETYAPVCGEIRQAIQKAEERSAEWARERARQQEETRRHRSVLAARDFWGWSEVTEAGRRAVYVFRHDVPRDDVPEGAAPEESPHVDLRGLRRAIVDLGLPDVRWDGSALAETERQLEGLGFGRWWRDLFHEDFRTFTAPPSAPGSPSGRGNPSGGTATGGTGGFSGGFSCGGGF